MGNNAGKEEHKGTVSSPPQNPPVQTPGTPQTQKTPQEIKNEQEIKKLEEKARQAAEALKQSALVQEGEKKLKETAVSEPKVQKVESKPKEPVPTPKPVEKVIEVKPIEKIAEVKPVEVKKQAPEQNFTQQLNSIVGTADTYFKEAEKVACESFKTVKSAYTVVNNEAPIYISAYKRDYVFPVDSRIRAGGHYAITGLTFLISLKTKRGILPTIRNTAVVGLTTGFLFHPENMNPFRRENFPGHSRETWN